MMVSPGLSNSRLKSKFNSKTTRYVLKSGSHSLKRGPLGVIDTVSNKRQKIQVNFTQESCLTSCGHLSPQSSCLSSVQLSPSKALRAANLIKRFAGTIAKAKQNTLFDHIDPVSLRHEKEKLERQQLEETVRIENQIRSTKLVELRLRRAKERQALEEMEKSVEIEDNFKVLKEFEMLLSNT